MKGFKLRGKLIAVALGIVILVMGASTVVVTLLVSSQNADVSAKFLRTAFNIIRDDLIVRSDDITIKAAQMVTSGDLASRATFLAGYKAEENPFAGVFNAYVQAAQTLFTVGSAGNVWKAALFDIEGDLLAFFQAGGDGRARLGYAFRYPQPTYRVLSLAKDQKPDNELWKQAAEQKGYEGLDLSPIKTPKAEVRVLAFDNELGLVAYVPIMGNQFNKESGQVERVRVGTLVAASRLDQAFVERLTRLTDTKINLFGPQGLIAGVIPEFDELDREGLAPEKEDWNLAKEAARIDTVEIGEEGYFRGVLPLYGGSKYVGAVAALYPQSITRQNTLEMTKLLGLVSLGCLILTLPIILVVVNSIVKPINRTIGGLVASAERVALAAEEISRESRQLADGSSDQAASLEETSASLEEMTTMTKANAESAAEAEQITRRSGQSLVRVRQAMTDLVDSMAQISASGEEIGKVVKSIDEIAFQTNLLALNAAVEAARAGETGAGFAVVADEVRQLALRAAEAAGNTQRLVEETVARITQGADLVDKTRSEFEGLAGGAAKVNTLVQQIASASQQQAEGVDQISRAVVQVDGITQTNVDIAEKTAGAAAEMSFESEQMRANVDTVVRLIGD